MDDLAVKPVDSAAALQSCDEKGKKDPAKDALRERLEDQTQWSDPVRQGKLLKHDLDLALEADPCNPELIEMRVEAGLNQANAYVNCKEGGKLIFAEEAKQELKDVMAVDASAVYTEAFQSLAEKSGANKDISFRKAALQAGLESQMCSGREPLGIDPLLVKGASLIKRLDAEMQQAPQDTDLKAMRVKAGLNHVNSFVHCQDGKGNSVFAKDAINEMMRLMDLDSSIVDNAAFQRYAKMAHASDNAKFAEKLKKSAGS